MLFPYVFVPHSMDKMQAYLDFVFFDVWCGAEEGVEYDIETLFAAHPELEAIITELHTSDLQGAEFFLIGLQQIFEDFKILTEDQIEQLKKMYQANNNIECVCANDADNMPATYNEVDAISVDLSTHLKQFYKNLYSQSFLSLKSIKDRIGDIDNHYKNFIKTNIQGKCPFCGLDDVFGIYHSKREAYDHYLPKDKYPFNSINFRNLAPACHHCNSSYKLASDPLFSSINPLRSAHERRKAFNPYSTDNYEIELTITLNIIDWNEITPDEIQLDIGPGVIEDEINTWLDVYGIEERYKAKCCSENDGKGWIREVVDECHNFGLSSQDYYQRKMKVVANDPWVDTNFLKKPFLEACNDAQLFD